MNDRSQLLSELERRYHQFLVAVHANAIISIAAKDVLRGFPDRLPPHLEGAVRESVTRLNEQLSRDHAIELGNLVRPSSVDQLGLSALQLLLSQFCAHASPGTPWEVKFEYRVGAQELVMLFAHLDGFIAECVRFILEVCPGKLKREKEPDGGERALTWRQILDCKSWEKVLAHMVAAEVESACYGSMTTKLERLKRSYDLQIHFDEEHRTLLERAELIRNAFVHNNARSSPKLAKFEGAGGIKAGDQIPWDPALIEDANIASQRLAGELAIAIAERYLGVKRADSHLHLAVFHFVERTPANGQAGGSGPAP